MLSSVVNSLTYRVLSHLFFTYLWHFLVIYSYFCDKKLWNLSTFLVKYDSIVVGTFCIHFWSTFWKKLTIYAVFGSQISKNVYILGFVGLILYCFVVRLFYVLFRIIYHMFCSFFLQKSCVFMFFGKHNYHDFPFRHCIVHGRVMAICASLWIFYLNISWFFVENVIILCALLFTYFV